MNTSLRPTSGVGDGRGPTALSIGLLPSFITWLSPSPSFFRSPLPPSHPGQTFHRRLFFQTSVRDHLFYISIFLARARGGEIRSLPLPRLTRFSVRTKGEGKSRLARAIVFERETWSESDESVENPIRFPRVASRSSGESATESPLEVRSPSEVKLEQARGDSRNTR